MNNMIPYYAHSSEPSVNCVAVLPHAWMASSLPPGIRAAFPAALLREIGAYVDREIFGLYLAHQQEGMLFISRARLPGKHVSKTKRLVSDHIFGEIATGDRLGGPGQGSDMPL